MERRKYSTDTLEAIRSRQYMAEQGGVPVLIKPIPETDEPGMLDPRLASAIEPMMKGAKGAVIRLMMRLGSLRKPDARRGALRMRRMMDGVKSVSIVDGVNVAPDEVENGDIRVPIRVYTPKQPKDGPQPVFYYIHGGGFVAGNMDVVDEMCKLVVQRTGCVAVQAQYRLAPENPYPAGLDDCCQVLKWIHQNAARFGGDPEKICASGDSAGGNLALVCALKDRDNQWGMVKLLALLYPTVDAAHMAANLRANRAAYEISEAHRPLLEGFMKLMMGSMGGPTLGEYLGAPDDTDPYVSPYLGDLHNLPPTILLMGEYDFLRTENDHLAKKLQDSCVELKYVRYRGLSHGFADQVGVTPQAEDALLEIGEFLMEHLGKR